MKRLIALVSIVFFLSGCFRFIDSALDSAGKSMGDAVGRSVGDSVGRSIEDYISRQLTPMMMNWYVSSLFSLAFGAGGYNVGELDYEPGQWTRWVGVGDSEDGWMERAYLGDDANGNQWWRVKFHDPGEEGSFVLEGLFSPERDRLLRLRRLFPGDEEPMEVPVERDTHYIPPRELGEESLEGAKVGTVRITVPAGNFTADHHRFSDGAGGTWEWWLADGVPGGVVRYAGRSDGGSADGAGESIDPNDYDVKLHSYGGDAKSELGIEIGAEAPDSVDAEEPAAADPDAEVGEDAAEEEPVRTQRTGGAR